MKKYLRELKQNSMLGRKRRFQLVCSIFGIVIVAIIAISFIAVSPIGAGVSMAGFGLMAYLDKDSLTEDQKTFFENFDEAMGKAMGESVKKYLESEIDLKTLQDSFQKAQTKLKELEDRKDLSEEVKKELADYKKELNSTLIGLKSATERGSNGKIVVKTLDEQIREQFEGFISKDSTGREVVDMKAACKASDNGKRKTITLFLTKAAVTTAGANLIAGVEIDHLYLRLQGMKVIYGNMPMWHVLVHVLLLMVNYMTSMVMLNGFRKVD